MARSTRDRGAARVAEHAHPAELQLSAPEMERAVIGAILIENGRNVADCVRPLDIGDVFTKPLWAECWASIRRRWESGDTIDVALVAHDVWEAADPCVRAFKDEADLNWFIHGSITGYSTLTDTRTWEVWPYHLPAYVDAVVTMALRRRVMGGAREQYASAWDGQSPVTELAAMGVRLADAIEAHAAAGETGDIDALGDELEAGMDSGVVRGVSTGLAFYDQWAGGVIPGHIDILGGYTNAGKTWVACAVANGVADAGGRVAFVTAEMPWQDIYVRLLANRIGSVAFRLKPRPGDEPATWSADERQALQRARAAMSGKIDLFAKLRSVSEIRAVARQKRYDLVVVDYGQLLAAPDPAMNEYAANTANAHALQRLAKSADTCILVLSQISAQSQRLGGDDAAIGFKSSGAWAEIGDLGLILSLDRDDKSLVNIAARKNRHGPNEATGAKAVYRMDRRTGRLDMVTMGEEPAAAHTSGRAAAPVIAREDWVTATW